MNRQELEKTAAQLLFGAKGFILPDSNLNDIDYKNKIISGVKSVLKLKQETLDKIPNKKAKKYIECLNSIEKLNLILNELSQ